MSLEFLITTLIIVVSPGTGVVYTLSIGLSRGAKSSIVAAFACTLGIVPHLVAVLLGLAAILHTSALIFNVIKYAGILYLLYMAYQCLREKGALKADIKKSDKRSNSKVIIDGILTNVLNPKLSIFFVAFLPQFVSPTDLNPTLSMLKLSSIFMFMTFIIFSMYGIFAAVMRDRVINSPSVMKWIRRSFATVFGLLALKLACSEK